MHSHAHAHAYARAQDILVDETVSLGDAAVRQALRAALIDGPAPLASQLGIAPPAALTQLLGPPDDDERVLATARELQALLSPRVQQQLGTASASSQVPDVARQAITALLTDEMARGDAARQLEGVQALSRRIGAGLLRRAADRAVGAADLPEAARDVLVSTPKALADAIDPEPPSSA